MDFYPPRCFPSAPPPLVCTVSTPQGHGGTHLCECPPLSRVPEQLGGAVFVPRRDTVSRIFEGLENSSLPLMPVLHVDKPLFETMTMLAGTRASILPTSMRKIERCKMLFDKWVGGGREGPSEGGGGGGGGTGI